VPSRCLLFLSQFTVGLFFFHLLLCCETSLPTRAVVLTWVGVLVTWVLVETVIFGSRQPGGPFLNPNYLSTIILSCLAYLAGSLADTKGMSKTGWVLAFSSLICTAGLVIIGSRSAALGILLISIFLMIRGKGLIRLTAVAVIAAILLAPSTVHHRVTQGYREDPHAFTRIEIWQAALKMGMDHPVAGVGPNLFYEHSPVYAFPVDELPVRYGRIVRKPHNEYLRSWAEGGLIGIAAAGFFLFFTLQLVVRSWRRGNTGPPLAMCAVLFQALFHDITEVFALMVLGVWWLSHLVPDGKPRLEVVNRKGVFLGTLMALILAASSIWL
jgi:O-antigen ligase